MTTVKLEGMPDIETQNELSLEEFKTEVLQDYKIGRISREASLLGRKEVLTGKAKFGIFGDGKEVVQLAMAKVFMPGDFRSGYYRDQTFMLAIGQLTVRQFFAQLYADVDDVNREPASGGRQMNGHFATRSLDENGEWLYLTKQKNSSADISPTAGQMLRLLGLAYASKLYRQNPELQDNGKFSVNGNEVAFGTIGNASTAEGHFWETVNAGGVLMAPMAISIWDDGYGISVPNKYQVTKQDLSEILSGFSFDEEKEQGYLLFTANGWNYPELMQTYAAGITAVRERHIPAIFHIQELTQPQGHSTSGSHERYKSKERLDWEKEFDCMVKMREWILETEISTEEELIAIEADAKKYVREEQKAAFEQSLTVIQADRAELIDAFKQLAGQADEKLASEILEISRQLSEGLDKDRRSNLNASWDALRLSLHHDLPGRQTIIDWKNSVLRQTQPKYSSHLHSGTAMRVIEVKPIYDNHAELLDGREILNKYFDLLLARDPRVFAIGEDVGKIGDVNQGMAGMQDKYGDLRITDTGIREASIMGQGIGAAMRGLRPIVEIQYLDYLLYGLEILSDDLSTLLYRTVGGQKAPVIVRTRGHRLEGIWHSGSPMGMIVNALRGMYVCVPRNMTQAAGFYNTLMQADEPALIIERLNGYRQKERLPNNIGEYTVPLGVPEVIHNGEDVTIVTYGACCEIAQAAAYKLAEVGISIEIIDVQTLLPFDVNHNIIESIKKTNRVIFFDEDVPSGGTAYMMQKVIEEQKAWQWLDSEPVTLAANAHRPAYGTDGDYFSKPNVNDVFIAVYSIMHETDPGSFPMNF